MSYTSIQKQFFIDEKFPLDTFFTINEFFNSYSTMQDYFEDLNILVSIPDNFEQTHKVSPTDEYHHFVKNVRYIYPSANIHLQFSPISQQDSTVITLILEHKQTKNFINQSPNIFQKILTYIIPQFETEEINQPSIAPVQQANPLPTQPANTTNTAQNTNIPSSPPLPTKGGSLGAEPSTNINTNTNTNININTKTAEPWTSPNTSVVSEPQQPAKNPVKKPWTPPTPSPRSPSTPKPKHQPTNKTPSYVPPVTQTKFAHTWTGYKQLLTQAIEKSVQQFKSNSYPMGQVSLHTITFQTTDGVSRAFLENLINAFNQQPSPMKVDFDTYVQNELLPIFTPLHIDIHTPLSIQMTNKVSATQRDIEKIEYRDFSEHDIDIQVDLDFHSPQKVIKPKQVPVQHANTANNSSQTSSSHRARVLKSYKGKTPLNSNRQDCRLQLKIEEQSITNMRVLDSFPMLFSDNTISLQDMMIIKVDGLSGDYFILVELDGQVYIDGINPQLNMMVNGSIKVKNGYMIQPNDRLTVAEDVFVSFMVGG